MSSNLHIHASLPMCILIKLNEGLCWCLQLQPSTMGYTLAPHFWFFVISFSNTESIKELFKLEIDSTYSGMMNSLYVEERWSRAGDQRTHLWGYRQPYCVGQVCPNFRLFGNNKELSWGENPQLNKSIYSEIIFYVLLLHSLPSLEQPQVNSRVFFLCPGLEFHLYNLLIL